ncbi:MAG: TIGR03668 family PPOX class F420-dependent oxidoreductase [Candidatus Dormibacteraeota bacterium]|nr:TIGR03668 family PPOX class F420-dependent oxidoreductase [Candidatus Dormibacteraeota bacterium]
MGVDSALRALAAQAAIGRLGTVTAGGLPHVVPVCFALTGDLVYSAVDHKPKSSQRLKRVDNIRLHPAAELLIDHYEEDWSRLWWVRATGTAAVVTDPSERAAGVDLLVAKYEQYRAVRPAGILVRLTVTRWQAWRGAPS